MLSPHHKLKSPAAWAGRLLTLCDGCPYPGNGAVPHLD